MACEPRRARVEGRTLRADISALTSVPELSLSIIWKTWRAIDKNSALNSSSSAAAARAARARSSDICCRRFARPGLIASSPVWPTRRINLRDDSRTRGSRTFVDVHLAVVRRVEDLERALEALRLEQELEVRLAARPQEGHYGFIRLDLCFVDR